MSCNCDKSTPLVPNNGVTIRSDQYLSQDSDILKNYLGSQDYKYYQKNFTTAPQFNLARLLTANNSILQALIVPIVTTNGERTYLISIFQAGQKTFLGFVSSTLGDSTNMLNFSGTHTLSLTTNQLVYSKALQDGKLTSIYTPPTDPFLSLNSSGGKKGGEPGEPNGGGIISCLIEKGNQCCNGFFCCVFCTVNAEYCEGLWLLDCIGASGIISYLTSLNNQ